MSRRSLPGYRRLAGRGSPAKRVKPKAMKKSILAVRIQPACPALFAGQAPQSGAVRGPPPLALA